MSITLADESLPARTVLQGSETFIVPAGKSLVVETSPSGVEVLNHKFSDTEDYQVSVNVYAKKP